LVNEGKVGIGQFYALADRGYSPKGEDPQKHARMRMVG
jgi:hypothetical protein